MGRPSSVVTLLLQLLAFVAAFSVAAAAAAVDWPTKPIKIIAPFPAGVGDLSTRALIVELQPMWKQPIVVEPRPGAGGLIGYEAVARSAPDGYTQLQAHSGFNIYHLTAANMRFNPRKDLDLVAMISDSINVFAIPAQLPVNNAAEFIAYVKANPGKLNYVSLGPGSFLELTSEAFKYMTGAALTPIAYKTSGEAHAAMLRNEVHLIYNPAVTLRPFLQAGTFKPLFIIGKNRAADFPNVPTNAEVGLSKLNPVVWAGLIVPAGTPKDIETKINTDVATVLAKPDFQQVLRKLNVAPLSMSFTEMQRFLEEDLAMWNTVVKAANIQPQ